VSLGFNDVDDHRGSVLSGGLRDMTLDIPLNQDPRPTKTNEDYDDDDDDDDHDD